MGPRRSLMNYVLSVGSSQSTSSFLQDDPRFSRCVSYATRPDFNYPHFHFCHVTVFFAAFILHQIPILLSLGTRRFFCFFLLSLSVPYFNFPSRRIKVADFLVLDSYSCLGTVRPPRKKFSQARQPVLPSQPVTVFRGATQ
jgi:hypothetical protein